ncbi:MAG TPA: cupredoxin domain-containing protein [Solirubrobacterales bacterium]|nr:cupredoxin domain-containing protein [Solirubrobacterales bacterium]
MTTSTLRPRRLLLALGLVLALCLLILPRGSSAGANATASAAKSVSIVNFAFKPGTLKVKRGNSVAFVNTANTAHTATKAGAFDTKRIAPGGSKTVRFGTRGTFAYHCKIHPFMKGKIVVE